MKLQVFCFFSLGFGMHGQDLQVPLVVLVYMMWSFGGSIGGFLSQTNVSETLQEDGKWHGIPSQERQGIS